MVLAVVLVTDWCWLYQLVTDCGAGYVDWSLTVVLVMSYWSLTVVLAMSYWSLTVVLAMSYGH